MSTPPPGSPSLWHTLGYFRDAWPGIARVGATSVACGLLETAALLTFVPIATTLAAGRATFVGDWGPFYVEATSQQLIVAAAILIVLSAAGNLVNVWQQSRLVVRWEAEQRRGLIDDFLCADWAAQAAQRGGQLQELSQHATHVAGALGQLSQLVRASISVGVLLCTALIIDPRATVAITVMGLVLSGALRPLSRLGRALMRSQVASAASIANELTECKRLGRDLHAFGVMQQFRRRLFDTIDAHYKLRARAAFLVGISRPLYQQGALLFILSGMGVFAAFDLGSPDAMAAIVLMLLRSLSYGQQLQGTTLGLSNMMPFVEGLQLARTRLKSSGRHSGDLDLDRLSDLTFDSVSFGYTDAALALDGVSFALRRGEILGVIGPSGSGKSTLAQLILRLRAPSQGTIFANQRPVESVALRSWSREVAWVPQSPVLIHGTVFDNISFFRDLTRQQVTESAKAASVHDVINRLPCGYDTQVGEGNQDLSGGEIQRVAIARALAGNPSLIVLDEPTSALDGASELKIQETLTRLRGHVSFVVIAHRLSTLTLCDKVLILREGRVSFFGTLAAAAKENQNLHQALSGTTAEALALGLVES